MSRQALRYIIRNTTLPPRVRAEAQLQLAQTHSYTRPTQIRNRCILGGKGRGILSDFKMSRVSADPDVNVACATSNPVQFKFRLEAMAGNLPGVKRASW